MLNQDYPDLKGRGVVWQKGDYGIHQCFLEIAKPLICEGEIMTGIFPDGSLYDAWVGGLNRARVDYIDDSGEHTVILNYFAKSLMEAKKLILEEIRNQGYDIRIDSATIHKYKYKELL